MIIVGQKHITDYVNTENVAVASTATVYTKSESLKYNEYFGLFIKATSSGTVNVAVTLEQSWKKPSSEGKSDTNWVAPDGASTIITLSDTNAHIVPISDIKTMPYFRLKFVGGAGNDASTTIEAVLGFADNI